MAKQNSKAESREAKLAVVHAKEVAAKRQRTQTITVLVASLAFGVVVIGVAATQRPNHDASPSALASLDAAGLQVSTAPWTPEFLHLPARLKALNLPPNGDESYHIHAHLAVFVDGKPIEVPMNVGISMADRLESPMHTHDTTGVIHMEAATPSPQFTIGAFFDLWGVSLTPTSLGGYSNGEGKSVQVYLNGKPVNDPFNATLQEHDDIVVGFGTTGSVPKTVPYDWKNK